MSFAWFKTLSSFQKRSLGLLLTGLLFLGLAFFLKGYRGVQKRFLFLAQPPELTEPVEEADLPAKIIIPGVRIDLPVVGTKVVDSQWEVSQAGASYLLGSGIPGREGNVVIYSHNENHLFGPIRWLEKDDQIKLVNQKGEEFLYQVLETKTVSAEATEVLGATKEPRLTLYTCAGFLDRERFIVIAELVLDK